MLRSCLRSLLGVSLTASLVFVATAPASAKGGGPTLELTDRRVELNKSLDIKGAQAVAAKLIKLDAIDHGPIHLLIATNAGTAQGVMVIADTIAAMESPVVGVVVTEVYGAGAALAPFCDRVLIYPSAGIVFTELDYQGVKRPEPEPKPKATAPGGEKSAEAGKVDAKAEAKEPKMPTAADKRKAVLEQVRESYLDRFHSRLAKRIYMKPGTLKSKMEDGGFSFGAEEAVSAKIAYAVVGKVVYRKSLIDKTEIKVTTTRKEIRTGKPPAVTPVRK